MESLLPEANSLFHTWKVIFCARYFTGTLKAESLLVSLVKYLTSIILEKREIFKKLNQHKKLSFSLS